MLSIIIPTLNAKHGLGALLMQIEGQADEIVISDGGSTDGILAMAVRAQTRIALGCKGRGWQLARGASWSHSKNDADWLLFLHADVKLADNWRAAVQKHMDEYSDKAGYFAFKVDAKGLLPRIMECAVARRCRNKQLPYGDQGLLISRALYNETGGFPNWDLYEDVEIIEKLHGKLRMLGAPIYTDAEKYQRDGYIRRGLKNRRLFKKYKRGVNPDSLVKAYTS